MHIKLSVANIRDEAHRQLKVNGDFTFMTLARAFKVTRDAIKSHVDKEIGFRCELEILRGWTLSDKHLWPRKMRKPKCDGMCFTWLAYRLALPPEVRKFQARIRLS